MKVSVIIPVYNEVNFIQTVIEAVLQSPVWNDKIAREIVVVDDHSTDGTADLLALLQVKYEICVLRHSVNKGKGAALRTGFEGATGEIVLVQDADLEYDPEDYPALLDPILKNKADVVFGSRFVSHQGHRLLYFWHAAGNKMLTLLSNMLANLNQTDMECGYKVFRSEVLRKISLKESRFGFEPEVTAKVARLARADGCRIFEVGISYNGRTYAEGKKINWQDGLSALRCIFRYNLFG